MSYYNTLKVMVNSGLYDLEKNNKSKEIKKPRVKKYIPIKNNSIFEEYKIKKCIHNLRIGIEPTFGNNLKYSVQNNLEAKKLPKFLDKKWNFEIDGDTVEYKNSNNNQHFSDKINLLIDDYNTLLEYNHNLKLKPSSCYRNINAEGRIS